MKPSAGRPEPQPPGNRAATASYLASMSGDLAEVARRHGLETLGYLFDMARLEAEAASRPAETPRGRH